MLVALLAVAVLMINVTDKTVVVDKNQQEMEKSRTIK